MYDLMKSIENNGVLVPLIVRSNPNGNGYEIISGHRRKEACKLLGINEIPVIVREIDDCDAVIAMQPMYRHPHILCKELILSHE